MVNELKQGCLKPQCAQNNLRNYLSFIFQHKMFVFRVHETVVMYAYRQQNKKQKNPVLK